MEERLVLRMMGIVSLAMTTAMLPSLACALNQEPDMVLPFLGTIITGLALGAYAIRTTVSQRKMRLSIRGGAVFLALFPILLRGIFLCPRRCLKAHLH